MLTKSSIILSRPIAGQCAYEGTTISVNPQSPLSVPAGVSELNVELFPESAIEKAFDFDAEGDNSNLERILFARGSLISPDGINQHSVEMGPLITEVTRRVSASIQYARGKLNPMIKELEAQVTDGRNYYLGDRASDNLVVLLDKPNVYTNPLFLDMVDTSANTSSFESIEVELNTVLGKLAKEDFYAIIETKMGALDSQVRAHIETDNYMVSEFCMNPGAFLTTAVKAGNPFTCVRKLVSFTVMDAICNNRVPGVDTDELPIVLRNKFSDHRNYFAQSIENDIKRIDVILSRGKVIIPGLSSENAVSVSAPAYRKWIDEVDGATSEVLLTCFKEFPTMDVTDDVDIDRLRKLWARNESSRLLNARSQADEDTKQVLRSFAHVISAQDTTDDVKAKRQAILTDFLINKPYYSAQDVHAYVRDFVCTIMDEGTDAHRILTIMDSYIENSDSEEVNINDAACEAITEILSDWVVNQLVITKTQSVGV